MAVKLLLNPKADASRIEHPETGVAFTIRPVSPDKYAEIRRASMKEGALDLAKWGANFAVAALDGWEGVGDSSGELPCTDENKRTFGRNQAINIMPWVIEQATSLDRFRVEEEDAAKNA